MWPEPPDPERMIKVALRCPDIAAPYWPTREWIWAEQIDADLAQLWNIPTFTEDYRIGDVVRIDADYEAGEVLVRQTGPTCFARYDASGDNAAVRARQRRLREYFEAHEVAVEGFVPGCLVLAIPASMGDEELARLCAEAPERVFADPDIADEEGHAG
jgi:hypothetical protein